MSLIGLQHYRYSLGLRLFAGVLIASVLVAGPQALVFAEEGGETPPPEEEEVIENESEEEQQVEEEVIEENEEESGAEIETGDAQAGAAVTNEVNTNEVNTEEDIATSTDEELGDSEDTATTTEPIESETASSTPETSSTTPQVLGDSGSATTTVTSTSTADVANTVGVDAQTGENTASSTAGDTSITTGDAIATARVVNVVNTNIFNSYGFFLFLMHLLGGSFDLDLRGLDFFAPPGISGASPGCGGGECGDGGNVSITTNNSATTTNDVSVTAGTGSNTAQGGGDASVATGDAVAVADVINLVNTNLVDTNYLLMTFTNTGDMFGDVVFPAASVFGSLFGGGSEECGYDSVSIEADNDAVVENTVTVGAESGDNTASSTNASAEVTTGNAVASASTVNVVNTNIVCSDSFSVLFQVHGDWAGEIFSAPPGVYWARTPAGLQLFFGPDAEAHSTAAGTLSIDADNSAYVSNNIEVMALSGANEIASGGDASITTGNAYAAANTVNIVNTNVVGRNWFLAVINILGNWRGNVAFGRPDLWIGGTAEVLSGAPHPGAELSYRFTVVNNGDAVASDVSVDVSFPQYFTLAQDDAEALGYTASGADFGAWKLGDLAPGEIREVTYEGVIAYTVPSGGTPLVTTATVESTEEDENMIDNTEELTIVTEAGGFSSSDGVLVQQDSDVSDEPKPSIRVTKTHDADDILVAPASVEYEIVVVNDSDAHAYDALLVDELVNEDDGTLTHREAWELGTILPHEEIVVSYTMEFEIDTPAGTYTNAAGIFAYTESGESFESSVASTSVMIVPAEPSEEESEVLAPPVVGDILGTFVIPRALAYADALGGPTPSAYEELILLLFENQTTQFFLMLFVLALLLLLVRGHAPSWRDRFFTRL